MKKLSLLLIAVLLLNTCSLVYAQYKEEEVKELSTEEKANYLHEKGMFDGVSTEKFVPDLDAETNGEQAIKIIGSALGWNVLEIKDTVFTDVSKWAVPYVEYARLMGVTDGVSEEKFGAEYVDAKRVITWLLASAKMDKADVWKNTEKYAKEYDLPLLEKEKLSRGDLVDIIYAIVKDDSKVNAYIKELGYKEKYVLIKNDEHMIPAIVTCPLGKEKFPMVVGLHGTASNKDEAGGGYAMLAPKLAKAGIGFLRMDFIGTGDSKVDYINYNLESAVSDANAAIDFIKKNPKVDAENIGLLGWSQGGTIALLVAGENKDVKTLVTWAGAPDLGEDMITEEGYAAAKKDGYSVMEFEWRTPLKLGLDWYEDVKATDVLAEFGKSNASVLAINGLDDDVVDPKNADKIVKASKNEKSDKLLIEGTGHIFGIFSGDLSKYEELSTATVRWFEDIFNTKVEE